MELSIESLQIEVDSLKAQLATNSQKIYLDLVEKSVSLEHIPNKYITEKMCLIAIDGKPSDFYYIPKRYLTVEFYKKLIDTNFYVIEHMEQKVFTDHSELMEFAKSKKPQFYVDDTNLFEDS